MIQAICACPVSSHGRSPEYRSDLRSLPHRKLREKLCALNFTFFFPELELEDNLEEILCKTIKKKQLEIVSPKSCGSLAMSHLLNDTFYFLKKAT